MKNIEEMILRSKTNLWCERGGSNPHGFTRQILSVVVYFAYSFKSNAIC